MTSKRETSEFWWWFLPRPVIWSIIHKIKAKSIQNQRLPDFFQHQTTKRVFQTSNSSDYNLDNVKRIPHFHRVQSLKNITNDTHYELYNYNTWPKIFSQKLVKIFFSKGPPFAWKSKHYEYLFLSLVIMFSYHQFFSCVIIIQLLVGFIWLIYGWKWPNMCKFRG